MVTSSAVMCWVAAAGAGLPPVTCYGYCSNGIDAVPNVVDGFSRSC